MRRDLYRGRLAPLGGVEIDEAADAPFGARLVYLAAVTADELGSNDSSVHTSCIGSPDPLFREKAGKSVLFGPFCGFLEGVVTVVVATPGDRSHGCDEIGGDEQRPPSLVLADVFEFVSFGSVVEIVYRQHHVPEGYRPVTPAELARPAGALTPQGSGSHRPPVEEGGQDQSQNRPGSRPHHPGPFIRPHGTALQGNVRDDEDL